MLKPVLVCLVLCVVCGNSKPAEKNPRVHPGEHLNKLAEKDPGVHPGEHLNKLAEKNPGVHPEEHLNKVAEKNPGVHPDEHLNKLAEKYPGLHLDEHLNKVAEKKPRVHPDEPLSKLAHNDSKNFDYDHEAFLGEDDAKTFEHLSPEESKRRLGIIVTLIDSNSDGYVTEREMKLWIDKTQHKHILMSVRGQWHEYDHDNDKQITWAEYKNATFGSYMEDPHHQEGHDYDHTLARDERRFKVADKNGDHKADEMEFAAFLFPEEFDHMKDLVVQETIEDIDKNGDGFIDLKEYIGDMFTPDSDNGTDPEWVESERRHFAEFRDKNKDGKMDREEVVDWIQPKDYDHIEAEAKHLVQEADQNGDGKLTAAEIMEKFDLFVGSKVTDYGDALMRHDEF